MTPIRIDVKKDDRLKMEFRARDSGQKLGPFLRMVALGLDVKYFAGLDPGELLRLRAWVKDKARGTDDAVSVLVSEEDMKLLKAKLKGINAETLLDFNLRDLFRLVGLAGVVKVNVEPLWRNKEGGKRL